MQRYMPDWWALPAIDDNNREFFTSGKIVIQACKSCETLQHPPEDVCHACQGTTFNWRACSGEGVVYSHTVVEHPIPAALKERVPYIVVVVSLDDHPQIRVLGNLVNIDPEKVEVGQPVHAVFETIEDKEYDVTLKIPQWAVVN